MLIFRRAQTEAQNWSSLANAIELDDEDGVDIDVPPSMSALSSYCATLGHKANHHFNALHRNSRYAPCFHPRFGAIKSIRVLTIQERAASLRSMRSDLLLLADALGVSDPERCVTLQRIDHELQHRLTRKRRHDGSSTATESRATTELWSGVECDEEILVDYGYDDTILREIESKWLARSQKSHVNHIDSYGQHTVDDLNDTVPQWYAVGWFNHRRSLITELLKL